MLRHRSNSGSIIFLRSVIVSVYVFAFALWLRAIIDPETSWQPSLEEARISVRDGIPWLGAIFAAVYAGFYSRYASQWSYIAGLYNQIMAASAVTTVPEEENEALLNWQAAFIEDCYHLHLDRKQVFAFVIKQMLGEEAVLKTFISCTPDDIVDEILKRNGISKPAT